MKPTAKMLGKLPAPLLGADAPRSDGEVSDAFAKAKASFETRDAIARARLAPGAIVDRIASVAKALETLTEPPVLGVRANGNENTPSKAVWDDARRVALERLKALHKSLKKTLEQPIPPPVPIPAPPPGPAPIPVPAIRGARDRIDEDKLTDELSQLKQTLDKHKPRRSED